MRGYHDTGQKGFKRISCIREGVVFRGRKQFLAAGMASASKFYRIWQYLWTLRHAEYHKNRNTFWDKAAFIWYHRRKYVLGNRLGFEIPENCFEKGLLIYHIAPIVVNEDAGSGKTAMLQAISVWEIPVPEQKALCLAKT